MNLYLLDTLKATRVATYRGYHIHDTGSPAIGHLHRILVSYTIQPNGCPDRRTRLLKTSYPDVDAAKRAIDKFNPRPAPTR
jgi:hypothetical protein